MLEGEPNKISTLLTDNQPGTISYCDKEKGIKHTRRLALMKPRALLRPSGLTSLLPPSLQVAYAREFQHKTNALKRSLQSS